MIASLLRRLSSAGFRRGMSGSRVWLVVGVAAAGARLLRYLARDSEEILYRTRVVTGDRFEIITKPPKTK